MFGIEVLHVHYAIPHAYAGYMAKQMLAKEGIYIPMITTLHGTDITLVGKHPFYKPAVTFSINESDVVTAVSESLKKDTLALFDIKNEIEVIPNFIDTKKYAHDYTDCQRSLMAKDHERIVTHISNFRKVKRIADVVDIFNKIQARIPAKLVMVGEGPEREKAEIQCEALGISDKVLFLGNSNEIDRILCFSDLFLLPSESESFGLAALEAMVNEVPVISSNAGGIPEVNIHGETGFLSPVGAVDEMAENALAILQDPEVLEQFKKRAVLAAQKFDITNILPLYENVYKKAFVSRKTLSS
jgi:N-acetyl-alpha-D-glucosaminyl L-malate synthase BshA